MLPRIRYFYIITLPGFIALYEPRFIPNWINNSHLPWILLHVLTENSLDLGISGVRMGLTEWNSRGMITGFLGFILGVWVDVFTCCEIIWARFGVQVGDSRSSWFRCYKHCF